MFNMKLLWFPEQTWRRHTFHLNVTCNTFSWFQFNITYNYSRTTETVSYHMLMPSVKRQILFSPTICAFYFPHYCMVLRGILHGIWARVGKCTLLTPQYCSGSSSWEVVVSRKGLQPSVTEWQHPLVHCSVLLMLAHLQSHQTHCPDCCWSGPCLAF